MYWRRRLCSRKLNFRLVIALWSIVCNGVDSALLSPWCDIERFFGYTIIVIKNLHANDLTLTWIAAFTLICTQPQITQNMKPMKRKIVFENTQIPKLQVLWASQQQPHHKCRGNPLLFILTNAAVNGGWSTKYLCQEKYTETADSMKRGVVEVPKIDSCGRCSARKSYSWFDVTTT